MKKMSNEPRYTVGRDSPHTKARGSLKPTGNIGSFHKPTDTKPRGTPSVQATGGKQAPVGGNYHSPTPGRDIPSGKTPFGRAR